MLLKDAQLVVLFFNGALGVHEPLAEGLVLVRLDHLRRGRDVRVVRALRKLWVFNRHELVQSFIKLDSFANVHGLVISVNLVWITEGRVDLLLNDSFHAICELVIQGIQKVFLGSNFLLRESTHRDKFLDEPLVGLSQLAQLDVD